MSSSASKSRRAYGAGSIVEIGGRYYGQWYLDGKRIKRVLGPIRVPATNDGLTKRMAEDRLRAVMAEVKSPPVEERLTVEEVGARYLKYTKMIGLKVTTTDSYESYLRVHVVPRLGNRPIAKLTKKDVQEFQDGCLAAGQSRRSTNLYRGFLHGICEYAVEEGWAKTNPVKLVKRLKIQKTKEIQFLTPSELNTLLSVGVLDTSVGRVDALLYYAAAMSGLRQGELIGLRWKDVDWTARAIRVRQSFSRGEKTTPKSDDSSRRVPLADDLARALDAHYLTSPWQADDDLVFAHPETGKQLERSRLLKRFKAGLVRANVGPFKPRIDRETGKLKIDASGQPMRVPALTFHDLRHTFGTQMAAAGVPLKTIQEWMGHDDIKTTMIYAHYMPADNEADMLGQAMSGIRLGSNLGSNLSDTDSNHEHLIPANAGPSN